ncbi:putative ADP-ribosylation factor-binding protein GGA1 [Daphnia magna]|uniref:Putative ADP-ribosylation factor-binding protein GGA1 n=1 Tax=Daphnia magna TaxID=35525 RepID=A0A0P5NLR4_9CRUS|nr:putative ADP-ribosylation factor-binding protein GGA1 [Daphnia magna]
METVAAFFGGNPFATPIGQLIERATDASLSDEDWALNIEICDLINEQDDGPRDAVRAIKKRLQLNAGKNHAVVMHTLIVLETCVKNCGRRFHVLVCSKDFVQELVKLIGPKNDPPTELQEKVLTLIQSWSDAFQQYPELHGVTQVYQELKSKGIEFPMTNMDLMAPILTPQKTFTQSETVPAVHSNPVSAIQPVYQRPSTADPQQTPPGVDSSALSANQSIDLSGPQLTKLQHELSVVEGNMSVLSEMLAEMSPGQENPADLELLCELYATCRTMQQRLVDLVDRVANDEITAHLLKINDDLNNLFLRYERYEKNRQAVVQGAGSETLQKTTPRPTSALIDLADHYQPSASAAAAALPTITTQLQGLGLKNADESEFDMFAQSRNVTYESSKPSAGSAYGDPDQLDASLGTITQQRKQEGGIFEGDFLQGVKDEDIEEMEAWLEKEPHLAEDATLTPAMKEYLKKRSDKPEGAGTSGEGSSSRSNDSNLFSL